MVRILVVEDHENLRKSLSELLLQEGYQVHLAGNLKDAEIEMANKPQLIVLDWMLPDGQGLDFVKQLRRQGDNTPVIFLSARAEVVDKVLGLEMGANDYMTKPFEPRELLARLRLRLREAPQGQRITNGLADDGSQILHVGCLKIDRAKHKIEFASRVVELVNKEFELLCLLAEVPEKVFSRDEILNKVWGYDVFPTTRTVDTHIMQLRQKIDEQLIETVRAVGYRLKVPTAN
jgi:DNA-binding response OmpR family regulator